MASKICHKMMFFNINISLNDILLNKFRHRHMHFLNMDESGKIGVYEFIEFENRLELVLLEKGYKRLSESLGGIKSLRDKGIKVYRLNCITKLKHYLYFNYFDRDFYGASGALVVKRHSVRGEYGQSQRLVKKEIRNIRKGAVRKRIFDTDVVKRAKFILREWREESIRPYLEREI